jgi:S1-C subfamily serine protease
VLTVKGSQDVKSGQEVFTLGFPNIQLQGIETKYTQGHISSLSGFGDDPRLFQVSVAIQPGNSGGPLLDTSGQCIGLVVATLNVQAAAVETGAIPQNVNYALKGSFMTGFLEAIPELSGKLSKSRNWTWSRTQLVNKTSEAVVMVLGY